MILAPLAPDSDAAEGAAASQVRALQDRLDASADLSGVLEIRRLSVPLDAEQAVRLLEHTSADLVVFGRARVAADVARCAAASLHEGLAETVTLQRLGVHPQPHKTPSSTNPIESMTGICRATSRNGKC